MKKLLALFTAIVIIVSVLTPCVSAETSEDGKYEYYILPDGTAEICRYIGNDSKVVIPSKLGGKKVVGIKPYLRSQYCGAFEGKLVTSVTIPDTVTYIGDYTFRNCNILTTVKIGKNVKSIGNSAFNNCTNLSKITIPSDVETIGDSAFRDCVSLNAVKIPSSVKIIGSDEFNGCVNLKTVNILSGVKTIGTGAFFGCANLKTIIIPDSVAEIGPSAFYNTEWYDKKPNGIVYAGKVAYKYKGEKSGSLTIKAGTKSITGYAFERLDITSVTIPDSVTVIGESAFELCEKLTSVKMGKGVKNIGWGAFGSCQSLKSITIPSGVKNIESFTFKGCTGLTSVTIPKTVTSIGQEAFNRCTGLKSVTIQSGVKSIGYSAFKDCKNLKTVSVSESVSIIEPGAFENTLWLNNKKGAVYVGNVFLRYNGDPPATVAIKKGTKGIAGGAFWNCKTLTAVTIPESVTYIGESAFSGCNIKTITVPKNVAIIGDHAFKSLSVNTIYFKSKKPPTFLVQYAGTYSLNAVITVPQGSKSAYEEAMRNRIYGITIIEAS